jgi:phosphopantothenoylcysteine decarboxylase/phosphopantothenate--cysteine ligase
MHPSDEIRGVKSKKLSNKKIILGITGSIASVECIRLSRELIRHGAKVFPVLTSAATKIINPNSLEFATGNKPILTLTGKIEHVSYCGRVKDAADLLLISPCTANTISKIAHGIDDTTVTTFATTAIGSRIPILIVPAMHLSMYDHKIVQNNIEKCKKIGIKFIEPNIKDNKAKLPGIDEIVANTIREAGKRDMENKNILVIGGSTVEHIDSVRTISNRSSGKTAVSLAYNAFVRGANIELWYGCSREPVPRFIKTIKFETVENLIEMLENNDLNTFDMIIVCAAISDYIINKKVGKISSGKKKLIIELSPAPKIIKRLKEKTLKSKIIGFKLEEKQDEIVEKAFNLLKKNNLDFVVANTIYGLENVKNKMWIVDKKRNVINIDGTKEILTDQILNTIIKECIK